MHFAVLNHSTEETGYGKAFGPYSRTKQAQEKLAWEYYREKGLRLTVIKPAIVYGPESGPWLHDVVDVLRTGAPPLIAGDDFNAGLAYVDNVADVLILAGCCEQAVGRVYNSCDGLDVTQIVFIFFITLIDQSFVVRCLMQIHFSNPLTTSKQSTDNLVRFTQKNII